VQPIWTSLLGLLTIYLVLRTKLASHEASLTKSFFIFHTNSYSRNLRSHGLISRLQILMYEPIIPSSLNRGDHICSIVHWWNVRRQVIRIWLRTTRLIIAGRSFWSLEEDVRPRVRIAPLEWIP